MKPRILQLVDSFDEGGSERQALELSRLLHGSGKYELYLASLKPEGVLRSSIEGLNLGEVPSYPLKSFYDRNAVIQLRRFVHHLRSSRVDILHTHDFYTNILPASQYELHHVVKLAGCATLRSNKHKS